MPESAGSQWERINWPDPENGPLTIAVRCELVRGRVQATGMTIEALDPGSGPIITGEVLRSIPVATLLEELSRDRAESLMKLAGSPRKHEALPGKKRDVSVALGELDQAGSPLPSSRPSRPGAKYDYAEVAHVYAAAPSKPVQAVRLAFGVSEATARNLVRRARSLGLLAQTTPGRPSGLASQERLKAQRLSTPATRTTRPDGGRTDASD